MRAGGARGAEISVAAAAPRGVSATDTDYRTFVADTTYGVYRRVRCCVRLAIATRRFHGRASLARGKPTKLGRGGAARVQSLPRD